VEAFLVSLSTVAIAEMGDRTQLLALVLATRFRRPVVVLAGIFCATLANHLLAGLIGVWFGRFLTPRILDLTVGTSMIGMALWALRPDAPAAADASARRLSAFATTVVAFFIAEIGDKTQIATVALAAAYSSLATVVAGTTLGMMLANGPVVLVGRVFADCLPLRIIHYGAAALFGVLGCAFLWRGGHAQ
jgi:putative Ca2+/H+ antiporter (TMEM165/GDT1 family)